MPGDDRCPSCGLPRSLSRKLVWTTDGGIYLSPKRSDRLIMLAEEDISDLLNEGVKLRGEHLLDTLRQRRRDFTRADLESQLSWLKRFFFRRWPLAKRIMRTALSEAAFFGCGNIAISSLKPRKELVVKVGRPYHPHLLAGDLWGFWEGLYGVEALVFMNSRSEQEWEITLRTVAKKRWGETRERPPRRPSRDYGLEVCEKCRLPLLPWELRWDTDLGTIYQADTHRHMIITSVRGWQEIVKEVAGSREGALPPSIGAALAEKTAAEYRARKEGNYRAAYRNFFMSLPVLGWGKPRRVTRKPFVIDAEIEGAPFPQILAWKMAGVFEALEREPADIKHMSCGDGAWRYLVGPRLEGTFLEIERMLPEPGRTTLPF